MYICFKFEIEDLMACAQPRKRLAISSIVVLSRFPKIYHCDCVSCQGVGLSLLSHTGRAACIISLMHPKFPPFGSVIDVLLDFLTSESHINYPDEMTANLSAYWLQTMKVNTRQHVFGKRH